MLELFSRARQFTNRTAIIADGKSYGYQELSEAAVSVAAHLLEGKQDLAEARVAFIVKPGFDYVSTLWGIWKAGGIAVPLSLHSPLPSLEYVLSDAQCQYLVYDEDHAEILAPVISSGQYSTTKTTDLSAPVRTLPEVPATRRALIIYTSGTTGKPKGVVTTHANIQSQIKALVTAWRWQESDHILNVLPLHHVHGVVNVMLCALWSGACCEFAPFEADQVLKRLSTKDINLFMAVPTIYYKLINAWNGLSTPEQEQITEALKSFRLMVSGSAALPISVMETWEKIAGHRLLERYGMTEIGMAISNPYDGERRSGHIGQPLPGVQVRLVDEAGQEVAAGSSGEIQVKGPNVFKEYWNRPEATQAAFTVEGWFRTGDVALLHQGSYRILGRSSVDIIKSGGYKISALEIEEVLRTHPAIADCAVVGLPDEEWGEVIGAGLVTRSELQPETLRAWLKDQLPTYQLPRKYLVLDQLPRNAMGKVTKPELKELFQHKT